MTRSSPAGDSPISRHTASRRVLVVARDDHHADASQRAVLQGLRYLRAWGSWGPRRGAQGHEGTGGGVWEGSMGGRK